MKMFAQLKAKTAEMPKNVRRYYENYLLIAKIRFVLRIRISMHHRMKLLFKNFGIHELKLTALLFIRRISLLLLIKLDNLIN